MPVRLCFRSGVGLSQGLSRSHSRLEQIVRFSRLTRSPNFETCFITPSSYNQASLEFWAHFGPKRSQVAGPKHSPVVLLFLEWKIMHGQGFSSYLSVFCLFVCLLFFFASLRKAQHKNVSSLFICLFSVKEFPIWSLLTLTRSTKPSWDLWHLPIDFNGSPMMCHKSQIFKATLFHKEFVLRVNLGGG